MLNFLPFALPDISEDEITEVVHSLKSGWLTTGPKTKQFEKEFADLIGGGTEAIAVSSATAGLHLALEAIGVSAGDEVITTPYTFTATAEVIHYLGAHPVFVDIDPQTFNINPNKIEAAITKKTKAIIPVHFAGLACDMEEIIKIARENNLKVVEDAAHALPTTFKGKLIGALDTDITVYSFYATKPITTGEGGMIVTRNPDLADRCRTMRLHGISRDVFERYRSNGPSWYYEVIAPGLKYNLTDLASSIGIHQLRKIWTFQKKRELMAHLYDEALKDLPIFLPPHPEKEDIHAWHLYAIRLHNGLKLTRDEFIVRMAEKGISCSVHFIPLHLQPYWKNTYKLEPGDFPCALTTYEKVVSLPLYTKMTEKDQQRVITAAKEVFKEC